MFHIGYFKNTLQILQCICKNCSRVLLPDEERRVWLRWGMKGCDTWHVAYDIGGWL